jgi:hypothetical protein
MAGVLSTGGVAFKVVDSLFHIGRYQQIVAGFGLILAVILHPEGAAGMLRAVPDRLRSRLRPTAPTVPAVAPRQILAESTA